MENELLYFKPCAHCGGTGRCYCSGCKQTKGGEDYDGPCHQCGGSGGSAEPVFMGDPHPHNDCDPFQERDSWDSRMGNHYYDQGVYAGKRGAPASQPRLSILDSLLDTLWGIRTEDIQKQSRDYIHGYAAGLQLNNHRHADFDPKY